MNSPTSKLATRALAILCSALIFPGEGSYAQTAPAPQTPGGSGQPAPMSPAELDSLLAPIALYPDPLVAEILAASTYPLAVVDAMRWLKQNRGLKGEKLVEAAAKQDWDPSVQAMVVFPSVLEMMDANLKWTTALGNVFLAQQEAVMAGIQRLRERAQSAGTLDSNAQQRVEITQVDSAKVIVIEPTQPQVIYVPSYNPAVVFGAASVYAPYPAIVYPSTVAAASAISFSAGVVMTSMFRGWSGAWGWGCHWGPRPTLYVNNTFISHYGFRAPVNAVRTGTGTWAHNPYYRGAVPYSSATVANRYGDGGAASMPYGSAAGIRTARGAALAFSGTNGAGAVTTSRGSAARMTTREGSVVKTPHGTYTNPRPSAFDSGGARLQANSQRGASSISASHEFRRGR